ncbi:heat shock protein Hsp33 [Neoasaia chiangmaiensis NBRC 101099]|uniref:Heat-shock protein Hsp33 n=1 Tax=Neoasaia chiangmaiensis TaxID=320497 RepID=A0A1U9KPZ8_9PROT|nr:Hsp33 family molecular chaperone HslO [Neoasaia chiangmaiensis]AQS87894.1 heat-shock protein Hsp33 [Neoasaia chiangmaiensis]GBR39159.1 heat shock protein Hsp33 [Neoasaia chiangmaiensis NBRC 101099]GEN15541.1 33 kDa chaperonin [Neoasaia chiangmaiensis]
MIDTPAFLDSQRPDVPNLVVPRGVTPFYLEGRPVRGRLVRLGALADLLLCRRENPDGALALGGQALALVAGLSTALKFQGSFSLQIKGDGPVSLLATDCTDTGDLRLYIRADSDTAETAAPALLGEGYFAFTVDQGPDTDRHQGIVAIEGQDLSEMAMHYFATSEQHDCWVRLFCAHTPEGWQAGALILERIAADGGIDGGEPSTENDDAWETACVLADTLTEGEILDPVLDSGTLLHRLFGTMDVQIDRPRALAYGCRCSRAKLSGILDTFSGEDLDHMAIDGTIVMNCEFCNIDFRFARDEVGDRPDDTA